MFRGKVKATTLSKLLFFAVIGAFAISIGAFIFIDFFAPTTYFATKDIVVTEAQEEAGELKIYGYSEKPDYVLNSMNDYDTVQKDYCIYIKLRFRYEFHRAGGKWGSFSLSLSLDPDVRSVFIRGKTDADNRLIWSRK